MNWRNKFLIVFFVISVSTLAFADIEITNIYKTFETEIRQKQVQINTNFKIDTIYFTVYYEYSELVPSVRTASLFKKFYDYIKQYPKHKDFTMLVEGYTDTIKPRLATTIAKYPDLLKYSQGRADEVKKLLVGWGHEAGKIMTAGFAYAPSKIVSIFKKATASDTLVSLEQLQIEIPGEGIMKEYAVKGRRVTIILNMRPGMQIKPTAEVPEEFRTTAANRTQNTGQ